MKTKKRRPPSSSKPTKLKTEGGSRLTQTDKHWQLPTASSLVSKKYYYPAILEDEKHLAYLLTRYLKGNLVFSTGMRTGDEMQIIETVSFYNSGERLVKCY